jgi:GNAT superfamily N-acetyltransferase
VILPADTLSYWEVLTAEGLGPEQDWISDGVVSVPATEYGLHASWAVSEVVRDSFHGYGSHYVVNPLLDAELALEGYIEWATDTLNRDSRDVIILARGAEALGAATITTSPSGEDLEVLLAGIVRSHQSRGLYRNLFAAIHEAAVKRSCRRIIISTQVHNTRVQRVWTKLGLRPFAAITTVHATIPGFVLSG